MNKRLENATSLYLEAIRDGNAAEAIAAYAGARYTQHSAPVKDGPEGFVEFFNDFTKRNPVRDVEIVRGFEDGQYVFLHVIQRLNDGASCYVTADIFDTDKDAKLIEHWDVITELVDDSVAGHTQTDGPVEITDLDLTGENKATVERFLTDVLKAGRFENLAEFISSKTYVQHNPRIDDGVDGFAVFIKQLSEAGVPMKYQEIHKVVGCGDFVASLSEVAYGSDNMAVVDLFRLSEGKIVEHWDVIEKIGSPETWVNSGKF